MKWFSLIFSALCYMAISIILSMAGVDIDTWHWWAIFGTVVVLDLGNYMLQLWELGH